MGQTDLGKILGAWMQIIGPWGLNVMDLGRNQRGLSVNSTKIAPSHRGLGVNPRVNRHKVWENLMQCLGNRMQHESDHSHIAVNKNASHGDLAVSNALITMVTGTR